MNEETDELILFENEGGGYSLYLNKTPDQYLYLSNSGNPIPISVTEKEEGMYEFALSEDVELNEEERVVIESNLWKKVPKN